MVPWSPVNHAKHRHTQTPPADLRADASHVSEARMANTHSMALDVQQYRLNAIFERRNENHIEAAAWDAEADALEARIILLEQRHA